MSRRDYSWPGDVSSRKYESEQLAHREHKGADLPYSYSSQNHDWDLTLNAAAELIKAGLAMDKLPRKGSLSTGFSYFVGGMVLSFAAIESFSASVAFQMNSDDRFPDFDFQAYRSKKRFWDKMEMLMAAARIKMNQGEGLFQKITEMQKWRNLVTHASPYEIESGDLQDTTNSVRKLHSKTRHLDYTRMARPDSAKDFYETAVAYIELVRERSGIDPRASASYQVL